MRPPYIPEPESTSEDMDIYVDGATGNDTTGKGTAALPYATIPRAYEDIPDVIQHECRVYIEGSGGPYTDWPDVINVEFREGGFLSFIGVGAVNEVAGPFTLTGHSALHMSAGDKMTVAGAGWTPDDYALKYARFSSGALAGKVLPVFSNTADSLFTMCSYGVGVGDSFTIVEPTPQVVDTSTEAKVLVKDHTGGPDPAFSIVNLDIQVKTFSLEGSGDWEAGLGFFLAKIGCDSYGSYSKDVKIGWEAASAAQVDGTGTSITLSGTYGPGVFYRIGSELSTSDSIATIDGGTWCCVTRNLVYVQDTTFFQFFCAGRVDAYQSPIIQFGLIWSKVKTWPCCDWWVRALHFVGESTRFMDVGDVSSLRVEDLSSEANATSYAFDIGEMARVFVESGVTIDGDTDTISWDSGAADASMPAADTLIDDGRGAQLYWKA